MRKTFGLMTTLALVAVNAAALAQPPAGPNPAAPAAPPTLESCATLVAGRGGPPPGAPGAPGAARGPAAAGAPARGPAAPGVAAPARGPAPPATPATEPRARDDGRHKCFLLIAQKTRFDVLFVGDSITDWWQMTNRGKPEWDKTFVPLKAANFGIAGDTTQGVLWRMQNGELSGFKTKVIVFMLGTNNINRNSPAEIAAGDAMIIREFRKQQSQARVLVLGVFPRGMAADNPFRAQIRELNYHLSHVADQANVTYMDIGDKFLTADGTLTTEIMADGLHPTLKGYGIWADAIRDKVKELLRKA